MKWALLMALIVLIMLSAKAAAIGNCTLTQVISILLGAMLVITKQAFKK